MFRRETRTAVVGGVCAVLCLLLFVAGCHGSQQDPATGQDPFSNPDQAGTGGKSGSGGKAGADSHQGSQTAGKGGQAGSGSAGSDDQSGGGISKSNRVDVLFMIDNSGSMREEQAALREQFPKLIHALTTGKREGKPDVPPVADLHLGVVDTDMGLPGIQGIGMCSNFGDDGILKHVPGENVAGHCDESYPPFISFVAGQDDPDKVTQDFACISALGTQGCGFEMQLESPLKALWPTTDVNAKTGEIIMPNRITFIGNTTGHGDVENQGFLRNDRDNPSLVAVIVVSDEEDCSSRNTSHFTPMQYLRPDDPRYNQDLNLRCYYEAMKGEDASNLYPITRYINGLKSLREGNEDLVLFGAIVGVPPNLVNAQARDGVDLGNQSQRTDFYQKIYNDPVMQQRLDSTLPSGSGNLIPSCSTPTGKAYAYPPVRIVQVAEGFGANGTVQSICQSDFGPAIDSILDMMGPHIAE